jgi:hypothetical protein
MMNRILLLFFLLPAFPAFSQNLSEKLVGKWIFLNRTFVGEGTEEKLTWNQQGNENKLGLELRSDQTANRFHNNQAIDTLVFSLNDAVLTMKGKTLLLSYQVERLTDDTLQLLQVDFQYTYMDAPGPNMVHQRLTYLRDRSQAPVKVEDKPSSPNDSVITIVEEMPEFPGGISKLMKYLGNNIRYPKDAYRNKTTGVVLAHFIISATGAAIEGEIQRAPRLDMATEVVRIMKNMPRWKPGKQDGRPVPVRYTLPVAFRL